MHPLADNYSELSEEDLQKKITKLLSVIRSSQNPVVRQQALMLLDNLKSEQAVRFQKYLDQLAARNKKNISDIIDIK